MEHSNGARGNEKQWGSASVKDRGKMCGDSTLGTKYSSRYQGSHKETLPSKLQNIPGQQLPKPCFLLSIHTACPVSHHGCLSISHRFLALAEIVDTYSKSRRELNYKQNTQFFLIVFALLGCPASLDLGVQPSHTHYGQVVVMDNSSWLIFNSQKVVTEYDRHIHSAKWISTQ